MTTTFYRLMNRSLYIFLINWKNQVNEIILAIETLNRRENNMRKAISKTISK